MGSAGLVRQPGLFATYKPPGPNWKHLRDTVEMQLLKGLNAGKPPDPEQRVRFLLGPVEGSEEKEPTLTADYTACGLLGRATDDFCEDGWLLEKTTYGYLCADSTWLFQTREKLDRILAMIQGSHQKALVMYSILDLKTQEACEPMRWPSGA